MFRPDPELWLEDSYHALLVHKDPVKVQGLADPGLYVLDLVAELRHVGESERVFRVPMRDAANELPDAEPEIEPDRRGRAMDLDVPSITRIGVLTYVVDAACFYSEETTLLQVFFHDQLNEALFRISSCPSVLRCTAVHCPTR